MKIRHTLFSKIVVWFFLNLVLLGVVVLAIFQFRFNIDPDSVLWGRNAQGAHNVSRLVRFELAQAPSENWNALLDRYGKAYDLSFLLLGPRGERLAGVEIDLPPEVRQAVERAKMPPFGGANRAEFAEIERRSFDRPRGPGRHGGPGHHGAQTPFLRVKTTDPTRYWIGHPMPVFAEDMGHPMPAVFLMVSDSIFKTGLYPEPMPWLITFAVIVFLSIAWWFPMVRSLTRPLAAVSQATEEIARGRFDSHLDESRSDEIGRLASAINRMTSRLNRYVHGQKRFLSDVAHELGSPVARLQMATGVMGEKITDPDLRRNFDDITEEVEIMAGLVNELLSFSRAEINPAKVQLRPVRLAEVAARVVERENGGGSDVRVEIADDLVVVADPELLARALANPIRNAVRYAGDAGPIRITARRTPHHVIIEVADSGPGVPATLLDELFEPFFRRETDRDRQTGGAGLGLAIVKTCIEACQGSVAARNLEPHGLAVMMTLLPLGDDSAS